MPRVENWESNPPSADAVPAGAARKRRQADLSPSVSRSTSPVDKRSKADIPYPEFDLPDSTTDHIRLHFKLERFPGVVRVAVVPLNYTFAHLHQLILYLFGWNGSHLHEATVWSHVVPYSKSNPKRGEIKQCGRAHPMPQRLLDGVKPQWVEMEQRMWRMAHEFAAEWTCADRIPRSHEELDVVERGEHWYRKDSEVCLDEVWNQDIRRSAGEGTCTNEEIGIKYRYDLGSPWDVHILLDGKKPFVEVLPPSNLPRFVSAKGAGPIEDDDKPDWEVEDNAHKPFDAAILLTDSFVKWLTGEMISFAGRKRHRVWTAEEEAKRQDELVAKFEKKHAQVEARRNQDGEDDEDEEVVCYNDYSDYSDES